MGNGILPMFGFEDDWDEFNGTDLFAAGAVPISDDLDDFSTRWADDLAKEATQVVMVHKITTFAKYSSDPFVLALIFIAFVSFVVNVMVLCYYFRPAKATAKYEKAEGVNGSEYETEEVSDCDSVYK